MRKELELIERIENYLLNKMSSQEKEAFESEMNSNPELKEKVQLQESLTQRVNQLSLKKSAKNAHSAWKLKSLLIKTLMFAAVITGITLATIYFLNNTENNTEYSEIPSETIQFPLNDSLSADPNQFLEQEIFKLNTNNDTIIESKDGIVVFIPADAFNTNSKEVDFLLQGAIKPEDIIEAGLSTETINGEILETGGMFYIDAYVNGKRIDLKKELTVDIPTSSKKEGMQLYAGTKAKNGEIKWENPIPLVKNLNPVEITSLDFYPPGYEKGMNNWGYSEKEFIDSLYFSLAWTEDQESRICDPVVGELLFKSNCASCHFPDRDMTGPALQGARERWIKNSTESNFYQYIKNSQNVIKKGDPYAKEMFIDWNKTVMTPQAVTNSQIDDIMCYVENYASQNLSMNITNNSNNNLQLIDTLSAIEGYAYDDFLSGCPDCGGINPANIQTIWNQKFNNTNLATKEFEERLPWIHKSKDNFVLNSYANNLHLNLSQVDSMILPYVTGEVRSQFEKFALRNDGKVELDKKSSEKLSKYYEKKRKLYAEALVKTNQEYWSEQSSKDRDIYDKTVESNSRNAINAGEVFQKEFKKNLKKVYCELEISCDEIPSPPPAASYRVNVGSVGWNNIDRQVFAATSNRETTTFSKNGKTSTITYNSWSCTIENFEKYNRIHVYNVPVEFNSYVKLAGQDGVYEYKLNADLEYHTVVLAWTTAEVFFSMNSTHPGKDNFKLKLAVGDEWKNNIQQLMGTESDLLKEAEYVEEMQKDQSRKDRNVALKQLRNKAFNLIFACEEIIEVVEEIDDFH